MGTFFAIIFGGIFLFMFYITMFCMSIYGIGKWIVGPPPVDLTDDEAERLLKEILEERDRKRNKRKRSIW